MTGNTSKAGLTYTNAQGGSEQVKVDQERILGLDQWEKTFTAKAGHFAYISAQNLASEGDIRVRILVNGNVWKESSSSGGHVIATTSGTIGQ